MVPIEFSDAQAAYAAGIGRRRYEAIGLHRTDRHGAQRTLAIDVLGAAGELAVSLAYGWPWRTQLLTADFKRPDFEPNIEVRAANAHHKRLILHSEDYDDRLFILVTQEGREHRIRGWIWGYQAKLLRFWRDPGTGRPAYFVPSERLCFNRGEPGRLG